MGLCAACGPTEPQKRQARRQLGDKMQQLSGQDASFLYFEMPNAPMHIGSFSIYDPSTTGREVQRFKDILSYMEQRLHLARCFRQKLAMVPLGLDHPWWIEDPNFDLEYHVRHIALPKPGDWRQLCILAARLHSIPLDRNKPLWEYYVIEGLDNIEGLPEGAYATLIKIHHAAIDGVSGAEITAALHDLSADPGNVPPPAKPWVPDRMPLDAELMARAVGNNARIPFRFADVASSTVPAVGRIARGLMRRELQVPSGRVPRTRFNGPVSPHRVVEGRSFKLDDVKTIKNAVHGATINDAVLAIVGGALRRYLDHHGELPDDQLKAMAPISIRTEDQRKAAGNQVSAMIVGLGSHIADPVERLGHVHTGSAQSKLMTQAIGASLMTDYQQFLPGATAGLAARMWTGMQLANRVRPPFNCVVTNIPGPQIPLFSAGAKMHAFYGLGPILDGMALIHPVFSYCGEISISFTSCRQIMPDPAFYAECLQQSFEELLEAASAVQPPKPTRDRAGAKMKAAE